ncbi:18S rRNA (guanine-N(7))-methyltransferase RID2-like [Triticum aestivum]|uniref:18S rRNA (guanine-N(7))-methyltransferase RID2-like n=1 Tax=Triticum aestivum TaxID=4565 RepID=UPI001D03329F|nr:18S rRNA (guanine-N(7))-methyltransferase RID2-like [Triticum aestivum]
MAAITCLACAEGLEGAVAPAPTAGRGGVHRWRRAFYNESEARKYTTSSRIIEIQVRISERALELLALPDDGVPKMLLDIGCSSGLSGETLTEHGHHWIGCDISQSMLDVALERETEGDLLLADMSEVSVN